MIQKKKKKKNRLSFQKLLVYTLYILQTIYRIISKINDYRCVLDFFFSLDRRCVLDFSLNQ